MADGTSPATPATPAAPAKADAPALDWEQQQAAAAQAEAVAEEAAGTAAASPPAAPASTPAAAPPGDPAAPPPVPAKVQKRYVPEERFAQVVAAGNKAVNDLSLENARLQGELEATKRYRPEPDAPAGTQPPPQTVLADRLKTLKAERIQVEVDYDEAKLTARQRAEKMQGIDDEIDEIRTAALQASFAVAVASIKPAATSDGAAEAFKTRNARMLGSQTETYPYLPLITQPQAEWLASLAFQEAHARGEPFGQGLEEDLRLQGEVAKLTNRFGPGLYPDHKPTTKPAGQGNGTQPTPQQRAQKLDLRQLQPPDISGAGRTAPADGGMTEDQFMAMPAHLAEQLPAAVIARFKQ